LSVSPPQAERPGRRQRESIESPRVSAAALPLLLVLLLKSQTNPLMETSLRLRGGGGLRIHAKEKLPLGYNSLIQAGSRPFPIRLPSPSHFIG